MLRQFGMRRAPGGGGRGHIALNAAGGWAQGYDVDATSSVAGSDLTWRGRFVPQGEGDDAKLFGAVKAKTPNLAPVAAALGLAPADGGAFGPADIGFDVTLRGDRWRFSKLAATMSGVKASGELTYQPVATLSPASAKLEPIHASLGAKLSATPPRDPGVRCPGGMAEVEGDYCSSVEQKCLRWLDPEAKQRCAEFAPTSACKGKLEHKHFCVDRFEFPNVQGEKPVVMKNWLEAKATCESKGKRLCGESEWTLACEGRDRLPYPYGYARNEEACNIDKPHPEVDEAAIADPVRRDAEVARLDHRDPAGAREACVSPYGVNDMTGNVDEWVVNESGKPYRSGLKGGYWGPVRDRCRPMTIAHDEEFAFYQIGFRCCGDPAVPGKTTPALGQGPLALPTGGSHGILTDS